MDQRDRQNVVALVVIIALVIVGLLFTTILRHQSAVEDCLLQHRRDCDALVK